MAESELKAVIAGRLAHRLTRLGLTPNELTDDLDLVRSGVLDSLGFVDLIADLELTTGRQVDLERALEGGKATTVGGIISLFDRA